METAGAEAAFEHAAFMGEKAQGVFDDAGVESKTFGGLAQREGAAGASVAADQFEHGLGDRLEERGGQSRRKRNAEGIAVTSGIFGGDEAAGVCAVWSNAQFKQAAGADETVN